MNIKPEIRYGILGATGLILWTIIQYFAGFHTSRLYWGQFSGYFIHVIIFYTLLKGLKEKYHDNPGIFSLRKGLREGVIQLFITAIPASAFMFIYDYKLNPLWVENMIEYQRHHGFSTGFFLKFANDPAAQAIVLSNTETHLCIYFLTILSAGASMAFMISAYLISRK
ncbi:MAG: DUF4199 family protein [Bacteroidetes bacterium]|nr:DUF4199 family protein [Bacteroidota bacterium]